MVGRRSNACDNQAMIPYQPFIDDPVHIKALDRQRFVVLRAPLTVSVVYSQIQKTIRERLRGLPVSYPARAHVTLCGFAAGTSLHAVQELVRSWALAVPPLRIELARVSAFPSPFQIVIVEVRKTPALFSALAGLRARAQDERLTISTVMPVEKWTFHISVAYCSQLEATAWQEITQLAEMFQVPAVHDDVSVAEVVAFDEGREYSGGMYALGTNTTAPP
jgi:2'-5' RNA ligase